MFVYFEELARKEKRASSRKVAETIRLLHEGATAVAHINHDELAADEAKAIAAHML